LALAMLGEEAPGAGAAGAASVGAHRRANYVICVC
jgi:hypothetical protein